MVQVENRFCEYCQECSEFRPKMDTLICTSLDEQNYICTLTCENSNLCANLRKLSESHDQGRD